MTIKKLEVSSPQLIHLDENEIQQAKKELQKLHSQKKLTLVEKYNEADLFFGGNDMEQSWSLFKGDNLIYFVLAKKVQLFNGDAVRQTLVSRTIGSTSVAASAGIAQYVIFEKLIPKFNSIASDCQQSSDGTRMWTHLIGTVLSSKPQLKVTLLNTNDKTEFPINKPSELDAHSVWGESSYYQRYILVISRRS